MTVVMMVLLIRADLRPAVEMPTRVKAAFVHHRQWEHRRPLHHLPRLCRQMTIIPVAGVLAEVEVEIEVTVLSTEIVSVSVVVTVVTVVEKGIITVRVVVAGSASVDVLILKKMVVKVVDVVPVWVVITNVLAAEVPKCLSDTY